jgi:ABC-type nitrate/sulfonate/bicarbonate transport system, permease component
VLVLTPGQKKAVSIAPLLVTIALIELKYIFMLADSKRTGRLSNAPSDIVIIIWLVFIIWEVCTTKLDIAHPVLVPLPEDVFNVFATQYKELLLHVAYSMEILLIGFFAGLGAGVILGIFAGRIPRLREFSFPIANVLAPIPAVVFSPYLVAIMPTFRSASVVVIVLGIFWPTFLNMIIRVNSIDHRIEDSARILNVKNSTMMWKIVLPYVFPGVVSGLKVSMTTSLLMLNFAEMLGATHGMGFYIQNNNIFANYTNVIAGIILQGIVVTLLSGVISRVQSRVVKWR